MPLTEHAPHSLPPSLGNPPLCLYLLLLPAPGSGVGQNSPGGKQKDMTFSGHSSPQVWDWHGSQARSSLEDISLGWGRPSATHGHEAIIFCIGDTLSKPQPHTIIPAASAYVLHFYLARSPWVACGEPSHVPNSAVICTGATQQGCWPLQHRFWNICMLSLWLHSPREEITDAFLFLFDLSPCRSELTLSNSLRYPASAAV